MTTWTLEGSALLEPTAETLQLWSSLVAAAELEAEAEGCGVVTRTRLLLWSVSTTSEVPAGVVLRLGSDE